MTHSYIITYRVAERAAQVRHVGAHPDFGGRFDEEALAELLHLA